MRNQSRGPSSGGGAVTVDQQPVAILCADPGEAATLAEALRGEGFRSRHFISPRVMINAARHTSPAAIVAEQRLLADAVAEACVQAVRETGGAPLLLLGRTDQGPIPEGTEAVLEYPADTQRLARQLRALLGDQGWKRSLSRALKEDRFRLVFQTIARTDGTASGLHEVLVRMLDDSGRELLPETFLPPAARLGLRRHIDRWVILRSLETLDGNVDDPSLCLFVKLFPETACTPAFPGWLGQQLRERRMGPDRIVFQLPYPQVAAQPDAFAPLAMVLRHHGCGLALEHYAPEDPAATRWPFPVTHVKLAAGLTRDLPDDRSLQRRVQAVVGHARKARIRTIATRVQNPALMTNLWEAGVDYVQGYFLQAPTASLCQRSSTEPVSP